MPFVAFCVGDVWCGVGRAELRFMANGDQDVRKKFKTTKTSVAELKMGSTLEEPRRTVPVKAPAPSHQAASSVGLSKAGVVRHPVMMAGMAVLTGIGSAMYYKSLYGEDASGKGASESLDSIKMGKIPTPGDAKAET